MSLCSNGAHFIHLHERLFPIYPPPLLQNASAGRMWLTKSSMMLCSLIPTELKLALENPLHSIQLMCLGADLDRTPVRWERSLNPMCFEIKEDLWLALMDFESSLCPSWACQRETVTTDKPCCRMLWRWLHISRNGMVVSYHAFSSPGKAWWERGKMGPGTNREKIGRKREKEGNSSLTPRRKNKSKKVRCSAGMALRTSGSPRGLLG